MGINKQDNRVILLGKALILNKSHFKPTSANNGSTSLVSLGYFDSLRIYPVPESTKSGNWLNDLWKHSIKLSGESKSDTYYHPLYITLSSDRSIPDQFWERDTKFLFVTLVHFSLGKNMPDECTDRFGIVSARIASFVKDATPKVFVACYQSMNLSDMVVIWKSDSMLAIMEKLNLLYQYKEIGDLRTTCSFPLSAELSPETENEHIPYVSFRFSVNDAKEAFRFASLMHQKYSWWPSPGGYFITGTEDLNYVFNDLPTAQFLSAVSLWFEDQTVNACFQSAFYESSTHLGISNRVLNHMQEDIVSDSESVCGGQRDSSGMEKIPPVETESVLTEKCTQLFQTFQNMRNEKLDSWCKPVSSQLNALVNMSRICVLDGFCYLILDGVSMFCQKITPYLIAEKKMSLELLGRIQRFIRGWGTLVDQAIRIDGQFIQSPGFSPLLYDIPVGLLEFYIAFTKRCMHLMQLLEPAEKQYHYALFLLPKLCRRTKVQDIFQDSPPDDRLLYVDVPLDYIYDPQQILLQLCHEVAHYCGEGFRCRERRAQYFILSCAHLIAWYFDLGNKAALHQIYTDILARIPKDSLLYMEYFVPALRANVHTLLNDNDVFQGWQTAFLKGAGFSDKEKAKWIRSNTEKQRTMLLGRAHDLEDFGEDIERIRQLFEECYADISMIFLLSPTWEEYLSLYRQELIWLKERNHTSEYAEIVQRAAIVLLATNFRPAEDQCASDPILKKFTKDICNLYNTEKNDLATEFGNTSQYIGYMPLDLLYDVLSYLKECYEKMTLFGVNNEKLDQLHNIFDKVVRKHCIGCEGYMQTLAWYERSLLGFSE